jgi:putative DNA primase/helicase
MGELLDRNQISRMLTMSNIDGKIFNICSEVDVSDISRGSDAFKRLCSGEPQNARGIGENVRRIYDIPFLIFSMNQRPVNKRMDAAFRRRIVEIVFNQSIREEDMDAGLGDKLKKELSGIRNWMIEGYKMLVRDGFRFDHCNSEDYMEYNDQFFDIFARHDGLRASAWAGRGEKAQLVSFGVLYDKYVEFCQRKGYGQETPSEKSLSQDLKRLNFRKVRKAAGVFYEVYCENELDYAVKL